MGSLFTKNKHYASTIARRFLLLLPILLLPMSPLFSATTWNGNAGTAWDNAANWSSGIPDALDDVTIANVTNAPVISTAVIARSIWVQSGASLVISATGSLAISGSLGRGMDIFGTVENNGTITINNTAFDGILLRTGILFTNKGLLQIGNTGNIGYSGINNEFGIFVNESGSFTIDRAGTAATSNAGIANQGSFTNQAVITIGGIATIASNGIWNTGSSANFLNQTAGSITIDRISVDALRNNSSASFNNQGSITIGGVAAVGNYGLVNGAPFNNTGGQIHIDRTTLAGIRLTGNTLSNAGAITIGALAPIATLVSIISGAFNNNSGGTLKGTGNLPAASFTHAGGTLAPGYSPGKMTFDAGENFSNSTMDIEVNGAGVAGTDFDQIVVSGTATLGGATLNVSINYTPSTGHQMTILTATSRSGTFSSVTGLPANWFVNYTSTDVILSYGAALPVELTDFTAHSLEQSVQLDWNTASEENNKGFEIQRSGDGQRWDVLGFVAGQGNTTTVQHYTFPDEKPLPGIGYYRLRQTDFDGKETFSKIVRVNRPNAAILQVFPNPVTVGEVTLFLPEDMEEETTTQLFNQNGQLLRSVALHAGNNQVNLQDLPGGIYTLQVLRQGRFIETKKLMVGGE